MASGGRKSVGVSRMPEHQPDIILVPAGRPSDGVHLRAVQDLWSEYWSSLGFAPDFQNFAEELRSLPGEYAPPKGRLLLALIGRNLAGTAAFRPMSETACEAKRLYVRPQYRGSGVAGIILARLMEEARAAGYEQMYGHTLESMHSARQLYRRIGFVEVEPYYSDPEPEAIFLRLAL